MFVCNYAQSGGPTTNSQECQKSTELGSLVIGTGARSEEAAAAAASNLVGEGIFSIMDFP